MELVTLYLLPLLVTVLGSYLLPYVRPYSTVYPRPFCFSRYVLLQPVLCSIVIARVIAVRGSISALSLTGDRLHL